MKRRIAFSAVLLFYSSLGLGQAKVEHSMFRSGGPVEEIPSFLARIQNSPNTAITLSSNSNDTSVDVTTSMRSDTGLTKKSPGLAILMSAVIPGSGQLYVHRYITIPLIWGFGYYFAKAWNDQNNRYIYYRDLFSASVQADSTHQGNGLYQSNRDFYRDDRDKFAFYVAITYILNIVDAYVGASLYSFDVSDNLGGSAAIRIRIPIQ